MTICRLKSAHGIALEAEARIREHYPDSDITIHQDPASLGREAAEP